MIQTIIGELEDMEPISLSEMNSVKLMNRVDTKFVTNIKTLKELLALTHHDYYAQEINGDRLCPYRTIYWDTESHQFYFEHHNGHYPRQKVRVRTYLESDITYLEVKHKNNHGRTTKTRMQVPGQDQLLEVDVDPFLKEKSGHYIEELHQTVENRFSRITLVNKGKTERLTMDLGINFHNFETGDSCETGDLVVVELKRDGNVYSPILDVIRQLRIKHSGFSKYCIGMALTDNDIKRNLFKRKIMKLNKLYDDYNSCKRALLIV
jgi:hypothetical protein